MTTEPIIRRIASKAMALDALNALLTRHHRGLPLVVAANGECWDTTGRQEARTRRIWALVNGPIPAQRTINHHCDRPECGRPEHIYLGTQKQNMRDAVRRGRHVGNTGKRLSPEWRANISQAKKGKPFSPEHRAAVNRAIRTPEALAKRSRASSLAKTAWWARYRQQAMAIAT